MTGSNEETTDAVESQMEAVDWEDVAESEFVDYAEGVTSVAFVFDHPEIGLHGFRFKKGIALLEPVSFQKKEDDNGEE